MSRAGSRTSTSASGLVPLVSERVVDPGIPLLHRLARVGMLREVPKSAGRPWRAWCPICDSDRMNRHLLITLTGAEPWVECSNGCSAENVLAAPLPRLIADMNLPEAGLDDAL